MPAGCGDSLLQDLDNWASIQSLVTAAALIAGGLFAYFKFFKDRVYRPRVDIGITPTVHASANGRLLVCRLTVRNIGTSKVALVQEGTALEIAPGEPDGEPYREPGWGEAFVYEVFTGHKWIESGETIFQDVSVTLPEPWIHALCIELTLILGRRSGANLQVSGRAILPPAIDDSKEVDSNADQEDKPEG